MILGAALFPLAFYLAYPSTFWNFDGVACAAALELGNPVYLFHAQHLLYGFLGFLFWKMLVPLGLSKALPALQIFNSLLSAAALYFFAKRVEDQSHDRWLAIFLAAAAGFTAVFWVWSIEAQVYPLGVLGLAVATYILLSPMAAQRMKAVGAWHAVAILGHLVHGLWMIPALYIIRKQKLPWRPYLATVVAGVSSAYFCVAFFILRPYQAKNPWLAHWLKGSLGLTADRSMAWHWPGITGPLQWMKATPGVWWGMFWPYSGPYRSVFLYGLTAVSILAIGSLLLIKGWTMRKNPVVIFSLLWIGTYALFFFTWEPQTLCYRMTDLIPFTLVVCTALMTLPSRSWRLAFAAFWMLSLGVINLKTLIEPMHNSENNLIYQQTMTLAKNTSAKGMYMTNGGLPWMYLLYFTGRSAWDVHKLSLDEFDRHWSQLYPKPPLYAASELIRDPEAAKTLLHHRLKLITNVPWLEVS